MFCTAAVPPRDYEYANRPFLLYASQTNQNSTVGAHPSSGAERPRVAVFRCFAPQSIRLFACHSSHTHDVKRRIRRCRHGGKHWVSLEERCPELNNSTAEGLIGYAAARRSTENPRSLRFCEADGVPRNGTAWFQYHSLDAVCRAGDRMSAFVGFVH